MTQLKAPNNRSLYTDIPGPAARTTTPTRVHDISLKIRILVPLAAVGLLAIVLFVFAFSLEERQRLELDSEASLRSLQRHYQAGLAERASKLGALAEALADRPELRRALAQQDRRRLLAATAPLFGQLRQHHNITHLYFHGPDRVTLARLHQPERHGDTLYRHTLLEAQETGRLAVGPELGPLGIFTLRAVLPVAGNGGRLGFIELGEEIDPLLDVLRHTYGVEIFLAIHKQQLDRPAWESGMRMLGRSADWGRYPYSVVYGDGPVPQPLDALMRQRGAMGLAERIEFSWEERQYRGRRLPLRDVSGRNIGYMIVLQDMTERLQGSYATVAQAVVWTALFGVLLLVVFYAILDRTERQLERSRLSLTESRARLASAQQMAHLGNWGWEAAGDRLYCSDEAGRILGLEGDTPATLGALVERLHPDDRQGFVALAERARGGEGTLEAEHRVVSGDGRTRTVLHQLAALRDAGGRAAGVHATIQDVTEHKSAEERLRLSATVFESSTQGVVITDPGGDILDVNRAFSAITGYAREEAVGRNPRLLQSGRQDAAFYEAMWRALLSDGHWQGEVWNRRKSGEIYPEWLTVSAVRDAQGAVSHYVGVFTDLTEIKDSEARLDYLAHHDALTGLPNRFEIDVRLRHSIERAHRDRSRVGLLFINLDQFKKVNDALGHRLGDRLLMACARRLRQTLREEDTVARVGGDEFMAALEQIHAPSDAAVVAQKVIDAFNRPFEIDGHGLYLTASVGVSLCPGDSEDAETLIKNASAAMYQAKLEGRNAFRFFTPGLTAEARERFRLENALRTALENGQLALHYQPQVELETGRIKGAEALLRWRHPELGQVPPAKFIPLAEENGLILPIGEWVIRSACAQASAWAAAGVAFEWVAVNVSGPQIQRGDLVEVVRRALQDTGLSPRRLELEVTESCVMRDAEQAAQTLNALKALGVRIAIDDFGTGYSSMSYLQRLPVDKLKIDRSFVADIPRREESGAIARAVIALARSLQLKVVAEGVETEAQQAFLRSEGCDEAQGYLYAPPLEAAELCERLGRQAEA